jgi:hypothetical protein
MNVPKGHGLHVFEREPRYSPGKHFTYVVVVDVVAVVKVAVVVDSVLDVTVVTVAVVEVIVIVVDVIVMLVSVADVIVDEVVVVVLHRPLTYDTSLSSHSLQIRSETAVNSAATYSP